MNFALAYIFDTKKEVLFGLSLTVFYISYYLLEVAKKPTLICRKGPFRNFLEKNITLLSKRFWPTMWCFESRLQTVFASVIRTSVIPDISYRREILSLSDGGQIALDWMEEGVTERSPVVIILPGLTGASQADYIKCLMLAARLMAIRCVVFNNRGLGGVELTTPRLYCAAKHDDLVEVVTHVRARLPGAPLAATGVSMGGLILGNYLAAHGADSLIHAAMIISSPLNVFKSSECIERPYFNALLSYHMAIKLKKTIHTHESLLEGPWSLEEIDASKTVREFDAAFTTKHFGYADVEAYYSAATLHDKLRAMRVPVLALMAADDPLQPLDSIPVEETLNSEWFAIILTARGGHIGFMEGLWPSKEGQNQYMARVFTQYFSNLFKDEIFLKRVNVESDISC